MRRSSTARGAALFFELLNSRSKLPNVALCVAPVGQRGAIAFFGTPLRARDFFFERFELFHRRTKLPDQLPPHIGRQGKATNLARNGDDGPPEFEAQRSMLPRFGLTRGPGKTLPALFRLDV